MTNDCEQLDEYLLDMLPPAERQAFADHLEHCTRCKAEVAVQRRLDQLLVQASEFEPAPPLGLHVARVQKRRGRWRWAGLSAVAAGLALAATWWNRADVATLPRTTANQVETAAQQPPRPKVTVQLADNVIAQPIESSDPRVTIVWTYPVVQRRGGS